ncbi:MAG TPA: GMC oxidoreductase [Chthoniobacterales bacterium]|nr:GMC oxidoreductase [Chthoniobacterales bacterium]
MSAEPSDFSATAEPEDDKLEQRLADHHATDKEQSAFDYIIVGSGAGGGPLAARLTYAGKRVLVIEAGPDPAKTRSVAYPQAKVGEVTQVPGYYGAASEDAEMSWMFSVRHHDDTERQKKDAKYNQRPIDPNDPSRELDKKYLDPHPGNKGKQGIFYPRSSGIGGCTAHHAMITIAPNDGEWDHIAELTGDNSWRSGPMRGYFAKFENCQYLAVYDQFFQKLLGLLYRGYRWLVLFFDPRAVLDKGGHGFKGWAPTNLIDPFLVSTIAEQDRPFFRVIVQAALAVLHGNNRLISFIKHALVRARIVQAIDFNDVNTRRASPEGVFLIPIGIEGTAAGGDDKGQPGKGRRFGVREFLLGAQRRHPDRLVIRSGAHVTRVLFEQEKPNEAPRAIGVECAVAGHLYEASPIQNKRPPDERVCYFAKQEGGEVILCGGAFNTPQLLMLSGIGDAKHLAQLGIKGLYGAEDDGSGRYKAGEKSIHEVINLPGVGRNLQDRYEVTVVSELNKPLATLKTISFLPGDPKDDGRTQWFKDRTGLYATNGGTLAVIRRSKLAKEAGERDPDLFTFGAPAAFRGYYWNWSRELFKATLGADEEKHNIWTWVILKAYTSNHDGTVRLRSANPFAMPEICFDAFNEKAAAAAPLIAAKIAEFEAAGQPVPVALEEEKRENEARLEHSKRDLAALVDAVAFMREVNARNRDQFVREIQPGIDLPDNSAEMEEWCRTQAWGHHASCTCRIGSDKWRADPVRLEDKEAVIDSRFQVHGVKNLRIVDASVFPRIPGYFILAPIFMVSEKAADTLLEEAEIDVYPAKFEAAEVAAIRKRREVALHATLSRAAKKKEQSVVVADGNAANASASGQRPDSDKLPIDTVGLALSGGGIRSATFGLGVLQSLSERGRLRDIDFVSSVSGGGFTGSFLGRLFTRPSVGAAADPVGRVQSILRNSRSEPLWWLRTQANYIFATGAEDARLNLSTLWRNILSLYLVLGMLLFATFGLLAWLPLTSGPVISRWGSIRLWETVAPLFVHPSFRGLELSPWWWLPLVAFGVGVIPATLGFWLAPNIGSYRRYPVFSLMGWLVLVAGAAAALQFPFVARLASGALIILLLAWVWQEVARWGAIQNPGTIAAAQKVGSIVRSRLARGLGEALIIFAFLLGWVVLDTIAIRYAQGPVAKASAAIMVALAPALPILRWIAMKALAQISAGGGKGVSFVFLANLIGLPLALFFLFLLDVLAHRVFIAAPASGIWLVVIAGLFSAVLGRAFDFLNLSSLRATYAARLSRTFLGASNEERIYGSPTTEGRDVSQANPEDDVPYDKYHPERQGGPIHLINVCVNETVDATSEREIRERKGLPMCVTPHGVTVGRKYFAEWVAPDSLPRWQKWRRRRDGYDASDDEPATKRRRTALQALPISNDPNAFHVLKSTETDSAEVENLSLAAWTSISGAAFSTGVGRKTRLSQALFMGLVNVRLGYWWDSGILESERPGRYPPSFWRRLKRFPSKLFGAQSMLLSEYRGRFRGPSQWFWYLSDGGHFDVTGLYELIRRRVPFIILCDGGEDPSYDWGDLALATQQVREDFGAELVWLDFENATARADVAEKKAYEARVAQALANPKQGGKGKGVAEKIEDRWEGILNEYPDKSLNPPELVRAWVNPDTLGAIGSIKRRGKYHAVLGRVTYANSNDISWVLLLKPSLSDDLTQDILNYATTNEKFPQDPTLDQVFDDIQWESYRALGQQIGSHVFF